MGFGLTNIPSDFRQIFGTPGYRHFMPAWATTSFPSLLLRTSTSSIKGGLRGALRGHWRVAMHRRIIEAEGANLVRAGNDGQLGERPCTILHGGIA